MYENDTILLTFFHLFNNSNMHLERSVDISTRQERQKHTQKLEGEENWDGGRSPPFQQLSVRFSCRSLPLVKPHSNLDLFHFRDGRRIPIQID